MASFRSGIKIFGEVSTKQGCKPFNIRSYSNDRRTIFHQRDVWGSRKAWTPIQSSRVWLSLFGGETSPENEIIKKDSCDLKSSEDGSWLSFFKKTVSKEKSPVSSSHINEAHLWDRQNQKTLEVSQNSERLNLDATSLAEESDNHIIESEPLGIRKQNVEKPLTNSKDTSCMKSLSFEKFRTPILPKDPNSTTAYHLQPRKQFEFVSRDKFSKEANFQPCKEFFKPNSVEAVPTVKVLKSKYVHNDTPLSSVHKNSIKLKQHKSSNNKWPQSLCKDTITRDMTSLLAEANCNFTDTKITSKETTLQSGYCVESNYSPLVSSLQKNFKNNNLSSLGQNGHEYSARIPKKVNETCPATINKEPKQKLVSSKLQRSTSLQNLTEKKSTKENIFSSIQGISTNKSKSILEATAKNFGLYKGKSKILTSTNITSPSLLSINKHKKQNEETLVSKRGAKPSKSLITLSSTSMKNVKNATVISSAECTTKNKIKEYNKEMKMNSAKPLKFHNESFISTVNKNSTKKSNPEQNIVKSKRYHKSSETSYQSLLPSNTQPFIHSSDAMQDWNTSIFNDVAYVRKPIEQAQKLLKSSAIKGNVSYKDILLLNYAKVLGYGNRSVLESKLSDNTGSKKESNSTHALLGEEVASSLQPNKENGIVMCSSNTDHNNMITNLEKKHIPFCYEKPYDQWCTMELSAEEKTVGGEICSPSKQVDARIVSLPESCPCTACLTHFKSPPNQIVKRTFASYAGDTSLPTYRGSYKCQEATSGSDAKTPPPADASKKDDSVIKKKKPPPVCVKRPAPGCRVPESVDCKQKARTHPPCDIKPAPKPSYSECLRYPPPPRLFTECNLKKETSCPPDRKTKSYDGCAKKSEREELVCPEKPPEKKKEAEEKKKKKEKTDECDAGSDVCADVEPFKFKSGYTKPPLKCLSSQHFMNQQNHRSYSYMSLNSHQSPDYEYLRQVSSCISFEPNSNKSPMQCSSENSSKSRPPTTDRSCRKAVPVVKKEVKEEVCEKYPLPGCKIPKTTDCRHSTRTMPVCSKRLAPKASYSECIRERSHPPHHTECKLKKYDVCPDAKKKKRVYDGCEPKEEDTTVTCPEDIVKEK